MIKALLTSLRFLAACGLSLVLLYSMYPSPAHGDVSCPANDADQCNRQGYYAMKDKRWQEARQYLSHACKLGLAKSCNNLGWVYYNLDQLDQALVAWGRACDMSHQRACSAQKKYQQVSRGADPSPTTTALLVEPLTPTDDKIAQPQPGVSGRKTASVKSCMRGSLPGCLDIGLELISTKQFGEARKILAHLCRDQVGKACGGMGYMSEVIDDWDNATRYYDLSCRQDSPGSGESCHRLANYYSSQNDSKKAEYYFNLACQHGYRVSCVLLEREPALLIDDE